MLAAAAPASDPVDRREVAEPGDLADAVGHAYSRASQLQARQAAGKADETVEVDRHVPDGPQSFVLLRRGDKTPETLKRGDSLPDGRRIVDIQEERIWVVADGKRVELKLRPK